jgi:hypothetical protein
VLHRYELSFGDDTIPPPLPWNGAARPVEIFLALVGVVSIAVAIVPIAVAIGRWLGAW